MLRFAVNNTCNHWRSKWEPRIFTADEQCCSETLRTVFSSSQTGPLSLPPWDSSWQDAPCFCLRHATAVCCSRLPFLCISQWRSSSGRHRGQTGRCQTGWKSSSRETCLFVRGETGWKRKGESETEERKRESMPEKFSLAGKQEGRGPGGVKGGTSTGLSLCVIHFSSPLLLVIAVISWKYYLRWLFWPKKDLIWSDCFDFVWCFNCNI